MINTNSLYIDIIGELKTIDNNISTLADLMVKLEPELADKLLFNLATAFQENHYNKKLETV
jgi:hypothetical protein